ncbi:hypothetical protein PSPO01_01114 [Paraphaeosphaeria sporulosa]
MDQSKTAIRDVKEKHQPPSHAQPRSEPQTHLPRDAATHASQQITLHGSKRSSTAVPPQTQLQIYQELLATPLRCLTSSLLATTMPPKKKRALAQDDNEETATAIAPAKKTKTTAKATKDSRAKKNDDDGYNTQQKAAISQFMSFTSTDQKTAVKVSALEGLGKVQELIFEQHLKNAGWDPSAAVNATATVCELDMAPVMTLEDPDNPWTETKTEERG